MRIKNNVVKKAALKSIKLLIKAVKNLLILGNIVIVFNGRISLKIRRACKFAEIPGKRLINPVTTTTKSSQFHGSLR